MSVLFFFIFGLVFSSQYYVRTSPDEPNKFGNCSVFPKEDEWNRRIDKDEVFYMSDCYIKEQFAGYNVKINIWPGKEDYGIPYVFSTNKTFLSKIQYGKSCGSPYDYSHEGDKGPFHIPLDSPIEGGSPSKPDPATGDRHMIGVNIDTCELFETAYTTRISNVGFCCAVSIRYNLNVGNYKRPEGYTSAAEAGMPIFPGLLKYEEASDGHYNIKHALRFTLPKAPKAYVFPGNHVGPNENFNYPPFGMRFRLKTSFDTSQYSNEALSLVTALKRYGVIFSDQGGVGGLNIQGMHHMNFSDMIKQIERDHPIDGSNFEAVVPKYDIKYKWEGGVAKCENVEEISAGKSLVISFFVILSCILLIC